MDYMTDSQISSRSFTSKILYAFSLSIIAMLNNVKYGLIFSYEV